MFFTDVSFLLYLLPALLILYYLFSFSRHIQNGLLLLASIVFYAWGGVFHAVGLIILTLFNHIWGRILGYKQYRIFFWIGIAINFSVLVSFKYTDSLFASLEGLIGLNTTIKTEGLLVPIGLSYFFLRAVSYLSDIYKGNIKAEKNVLYTSLYFCVFFHVIAGPLDCFENLKKQFTDRTYHFRMVSVGICRFVIGMAKKILIADSLSAIAGNVFNLSTIGPDVYAVPASLAWIGVIAFLLQITFEFSGYSDMAVGLRLMFGFKLPENFNYPLASTSLTDFWSKWNITFWQWSKDFIFNPLEERTEKNRDTRIMHLLLLWIFIGFFYGIGWTFLFWGLWNFILIAAEDFFHFSYLEIPVVWKRVYVWLSLLIGVVMFGAKDLYQAGNYYANLIGRSGFFSSVAGMFIREYWIVLIFAILFSFPVAKSINRRLVQEEIGKKEAMMNIMYPIVMLLLFIITFIYLRQMQEVEFLFYRF